MTPKKRGRPATGSLRWARNANGAYQWFVQITLADGSRPVVDLDPRIPEGDREAAKAAALLVSAATRAGESVSTRNLETVSEYAKRWLAARDARGLASVADDRGRLKAHVLPELGARDMRKVSRDDLERLVERLDAKVRAGAVSWKTTIHAWGLVTKMFSDATAAKDRSLRVRADNPALDVHGPDRGNRKAKVYLYPSEFLQIVSCAEVPLRWRRMFALTTYLYARAGEVNALQWSDLDLERGIAHIHASASRTTGATKSTKTGEARRVPIEPTLMPLLLAMRQEAGGGAATGPVSPADPTDRKLSRQLQRCLRLAGLTRADLYADDATRKPLTFHDLRATGITWCAVRGDDPMRLKQRAGHAGFATTEGYIREAENLRETNFGTPFPTLPEALMTHDATDPNFARLSQPLRKGAGNSSTSARLQWRRRESKPEPTAQKQPGNPPETADSDATTAFAVAIFDRSRPSEAERTSRGPTSSDSPVPDPLTAAFLAALRPVLVAACRQELERRGVKPTRMRPLPPVPDDFDPDACVMSQWALLTAPRDTEAMEAGETQKVARLRSDLAEHIRRGGTPPKVAPPSTMEMLGLMERRTPRR